jgi:hypothetical protein
MTFKFELTEQEVQLIVTGLGELPAKASFDLLNKIIKLTNEQSKPSEVKESTKEDITENKE